MRVRDWQLHYHTLRHLKPRQVVGRVVRQIRTGLGLPWVPHAPDDLDGSLEAGEPFLRHDAWNDSEDVLRGWFQFLNQTKDLGRPVDWHPDAPLLWRYNLHYFDYLHLIKEPDQQELLREWVNANPVGQQPGWEPYPTSLRIINWCKADPQTNEGEVVDSLYQQAAHLYRNLETHLLGNHLLENARALVFAGRFFGEQGEAPEWLERGLEIYREQTQEQILDDGGHFERSPMYHALMLEGYLDVLNLLPDDHPDRPWLVETVREMSDFLLSMTHPRNRISIVNDATRNEACPTDELLAYAGRVLDIQPERRSQFGETGYYIYDSDDAYLIIDGGPIGPDHLPAHAHADIFSYELSAGGDLFIVDTGVYEYEAGDMRDYVRSTKAHNTVYVDGVDQAECWDSFRVARRYPPHEVSFTQKGGRSCFEGCFDGYADLIGDGIEHRRHIEADQNDRFIAIKDTITGEGRHRVESRIHLHPDVQVVRNRDGISIKRADRNLHISVRDSIVQFENGWYCPEFGKRIRQNVIVLRSDSALPTQLMYRIHY